MSEVSDFRTALSALEAQLDTLEAKRSGVQTEVKAVNPLLLHEPGVGRCTRHGTGLGRHLEKLRELVSTLERMSARWP